MNLFWKKMLLFGVVVLFIQCFVPVPKAIPNEIRMFDHFLKRTDAVYFGDSTINWTAKSDPGQQSMSTLLRLLLPKLQVTKVAHASYQADVFLAYTEYFLRKGCHPQVVIVPINLRSFSPEWVNQPSWQFEDEKFVLKHKDTFWMKFYRGLGVFKFFESRVSRYQYEHTKVFNGKDFVGLIKDFDNSSYRTTSDENIKKKLMFRYMYELNAQNPRLRSLVKLSEILRQNNIPVVFYITPIDIETGIKYLQDDFGARISSNCEIIKSALSGEFVQVVDLSGTLSSQFFSWSEDKEELYPNEHLKLLGRMVVVKSVIENSVLMNFEKSDRWRNMD